MSFVLVPKKWEILTGFFTGETVEIVLKDAFDKAGGDKEYDRFYELRQNKLTSVLEKDLPLRTVFDRERSNQEITQGDSLNFWDSMDILHDYLGMGTLFVPASTDEMDNPRKFMRVRVDTTRGPSAVRSFAHGDNNITGGRVNLVGTDVFDVNAPSRVVFHEPIHVLGLGHTRFWPSVMSYRMSPDGEIITSLEPTKWDVAYIQLLYATRQLQYDEEVPHGIEEAWRSLDEEL